MRIMERKKKAVQAIHFNDMCHILEQAYKYSQTVDIKAWKTDGHINLYRGWLVKSEYWKGGHVLLMNPRNKEKRRVPQIFIIEINSCKVYL